MFTMSSLQKLKSRVVRVAAKAGSKLLRKYVARYLWLRGLESYEFSLLRSGFFDITKSDIENTVNLNRAWLSSGPHRVASVLFFVNPFGKEPSAGPRNILGLAKYFLSKGVEVLFGVVSTNTSTLKTVEEAFKFHGVDAKCFLITKPKEVDSLPYSTISIATFWPTAYPLLRFHNTSAKVYLIQDEETAFYPAGVLQYFAEYTYHFGFIGITNAYEVREWYERTYQIPCFYFPPFIIRASKRKELDNTSVSRVATYFRLGVSRNAPELLYMVLKEIKRRFNVEVRVVGSRLWVKEFKSMGWIEADELRKLYENSDVCLYLMFSRHPGVIPLECMDAGAIVITNKKHLRHSYLVHEYNALIVEPTLSSIINAFEKVIRDVELRKRLILNGYKTVDTIFKNREEELDQMLKKLSGA